MEAIIASILGGLVSGLFTFLGVWLTIRHENKKAHKEELKRQKEKDEQLLLDIYTKYANAKNIERIN